MHVQEDRFVFQPTRRKDFGAADLVRFLNQRHIQLVHVKFAIVERRGFHRFIKLPGLCERGDHPQRMHRSFQKKVHGNLFEL